MAAFIARRLLISVGVFVLATFIMYALTASAGDPLNNLYDISDPGDRANRIASRTELLHLDEPIPVRWAHWLWGLLGFLWGNGTLGVNVLGQDVGPLLEQALGSTLRLIIIATVVAIVTGVAVGVVSALRQYSAFDYTLTFAAFAFFSLPIFWAAILLKQYGAIRFNSWLASPTIPLQVAIPVAVVAGLLATGLLGGRTWGRRALVLGVTTVVVAAIMLGLSADRWFADPFLGVVGVAVLGLAASVGITALVSGLQRRRVLYSGLAGTVVGIVVYVATLPVLEQPTWLLLLGLLVLTLVVAGGIGAALGGIDRPQAVRSAVLSAAVVAGLGFVDWALVYWRAYSASVLGRPIATIGSNTPNYTGNLWESTLDSFTHLLLPSITLILISFAQYTRYTRGSMLETMNQDYVRTARSKGLTERSTVMRHAFRNALIPVTTVMALDFAAVVGGAVITERVFGWTGMGTLFLDGVTAVDPNPVMAFFIVTGAAVLIFNLVADVLYAYLDPRIRLS